MPFDFNKTLWDFGRKIEDDVLPIANKLYDCDFKRNENNIFDIIDFKDDNKKVVVEVKGRKKSGRSISWLEKRPRKQASPLRTT